MFVCTWLDLGFQKESSSRSSLIFIWQPRLQIEKSQVYVVEDLHPRVRNQSFRKTSLVLCYTTAPTIKFCRSNRISHYRKIHIYLKVFKSTMWYANTNRKYEIKKNAYSYYSDLLQMVLFPRLTEQYFLFFITYLFLHKQLLYQNTRFL